MSKYPKTLRAWIDNPKDIHKLLKKDYFPRAKDRKVLWSFSNDRDKYVMIDNYLNYIWSFMHCHFGVIYDVKEYDKEPGDRAGLCAINTGLLSSSQFGSNYFYMIFTRQGDVWHLEGFFIFGYDTDPYKARLPFQSSEGRLPVVYKKPILENVLVKLVGHFYDRRYRMTTAFQKKLEDFADDYRHRCCFCNLLIKDRIIEKQICNEGIPINPVLLMDIWPEKKNKQRRCVNPRFDFVYPVFDVNKKNLDGCLCLNSEKQRDGCQYMEAKTLLSPKMAYYDALIVSSHTELNSDSSWLTRERVEQSIKDGCQNKKKRRVKPSSRC